VVGWSGASRFHRERISAGVAPAVAISSDARLKKEERMVSRVGGVVSDDFRKQMLGYGLTTAQILYRMPDHPSLLQTYVWQNYDMFPKFPALQNFLAFWQEKLEGPLFSVTVAHSKLIKPTELRAVDGVFRLN
jgi:uncharacterized protein Usg